MHKYIPGIPLLTRFSPSPRTPPCPPGARRAIWQSRPARCPESELPARRMPDRDDTRQVQAPVGERREMVDPGRDVVERRRPAAALGPEPAVLDVPRRPSAPREVDAQ